MFALENTAVIEDEPWRVDVSRGGKADPDCAEVSLVDDSSSAV
jgi:hypothetical protein